MMRYSYKKNSILSCIIILAVISPLVFSGCQKKSGSNEQKITTSKSYSKAVSDFYIGLAAAQTNQANFAYNKMFEVTKLYPQEPSVWANLGVFAMQQGNYELAKKRLEKAISLAPKNGKIRFLRGLLMSQEGQIKKAVQDMRKAVQLSPDNPLILFSLIKELERQSSSDNKDEINKLFEQIRKLQPDNLVVTVEHIRFSLNQKDIQSADMYLKKLSQRDSLFSGSIKKRLQKLLLQASKDKTQNMSTEVAFLDHDLRQLPVYQKDLNAVQLPSSQIGFLITKFIKLPNPKASSAKIDPELAFKEQAISLKQTTGVHLIRSLSLKGDRIPHLMYVSGGKFHIKDGVTLDYPGGSDVTYHNVAVIDYNYDFKNDLCFAGSKGLKFYQQTTDGSFRDITHSLGLPRNILNQSYRSVWRADIDLDGDLDLIMAPNKGKSFVLRNNGDGTFKKISFLNGPDNIKDFQWADLDDDGDSDAAILTTGGQLEVFMNQRLGDFKEVSNKSLPDSVLGITIGDPDGNSQFDIVYLKSNGQLQQCYYNQDEQRWDIKTLGVWPDFTGIKNLNNVKVAVQDFDNNGRLDVMASVGGETRVWLNDSAGKLHLMDNQYEGTVFSISDSNGNGRLDWIGLSRQGKPVEWINSGSDNYNGEVIRPRASNPVGDRRINSFGIGGILEARSGLIYQRQLITSPLVHFGLGTYSQADMLRIIWPNGSVQAEFADLGSSSTITNRQSLKGSCPWLFAYNGNKMNFVTDLLWRSPLGLRINAQKTAGMNQTEDWVKIRGDQLKAKNGYYDLRVTAELWETHFFDYLSLMTVDHPDGTNVFVDERFSFPPPKMKVYVTGPLHNVSHVWNEQGNEVSDLVAKRDNHYLAGFKLTKYQGIARKHYITIDIGSGLPQKGPLWLIAYGWVYPTDSSINVAISQGDVKPPQGISVQIPDENGKWKTVKTNLGFPEGKNKTVLINLRGLFQHKGDHRVRLTTSTQTYWDAIWWAKGLPGVSIKTQRIQPEKARLRYRGFSKLVVKTKHAPEVPDYQDIKGTTPQWSDLVGFYTRYGDVKPLLRKVDDRYVIMNAGDEMRLKYKEPSKPAKGWKRDFVMISDGWEKDGDYNTTFSKTVIPLPSHHNSTYNTPPTTLQNDPVYKQHKQDWITYQTRYVTPRPFYRALLFGNKNR